MNRVTLRIKVEKLKIDKKCESQIFPSNFRAQPGSETLQFPQVWTNKIQIKQIP